MSEKTIIILKKARAHGGHHGGAWKVAYADLFTAMMALFIVCGWRIPATTCARSSPGISTTREGALR
jgi:chemotaxis protein MotB